jgi:CotH kinase protein/Lamin Tail Domain/Divergent InlB B-repeat domain
MLRCYVCTMRLLPLLLAACAGNGGPSDATGETDPPKDTAADTAASDDTAPPDDTDDTDPETVPGGAEPCVDAPLVRLNELVAANVAGVVDDDGKYPDWIELLNSDTAAVDLDGWSLSDDGFPGGWAFPATSIEPGATLLVWASGNDRTTDGALHTDFALSATDMTVGLHMPDGCLADVVETGRLWVDLSVGRPVGSDDWEVFLAPTPDAPNTTESRPALAPTPTLDPPGGFALSTVTASGEGTLRYTLDSSPPDEDDLELKGPLTLDLSTGVAVVRVSAFQDGLWPSRVATATFFADTAPLDAGLPVLSLVVDPPDLFSDETGIYAYGAAEDYEAWYPYFGANFWEQWERLVALTLWDADGAVVLSQDAGIQIGGGYSRAFDQRNLELLARGGYGPEDFEAPVFREETLQSYGKLFLRNGGDWCSTGILDCTVQALLRDAAGVRLESVDAQACEPTIVYLDGEFWGLYNMRERLDERWIADHRGADPDNLDRIKLGWTHDANWEVEQGDWEAFDEMTALAKPDLSDPDAWAAFDEMVDLPNLAATLVAEAWIGNTDWWGNNLRLWRPREEGAEWRWMVYDFGHGFTTPGYDHLATSVLTSAKGLPLQDALENEAYRALQVQAFGDLLSTSMSGTNATATFLALADRVQPAMAAQRERWCGGEGMSAWASSIDYAADFASKRESILRYHVRQHLGAGVDVALSLRAEPKEAGRFALAVINVDPPYDGTYFQDVPVTVTALANDGWRFVEWSESGEEEAQLELPMTGATTRTAVFEAAR